MGRPKKQAQPKGKPKTIGFRVASEYAQWLDGLAKHDRSTLAAVIDRALAVYAAQIGYTKPAPERVP